MDPKFKDNRGHGTVVAGIVGGLPTAGITSAGGATAGYGVKDSGNFYYGLGVAPGVRLGNTEILSVPTYGTVPQWTTYAVSKNCNTPTTPCTYGSTPCVATVQTHSHNEYDSTGTSAGVYTPDARLFDISVRDADHGGARTAPLAVTVSAGNYRQSPADNTMMVMAPATAKNIISMGAAESVRPTTGLSAYTCDTDTTGGDNPAIRNTAQGYDVVAYCSRRGTGDGRIKPDLLAPATVIQGPRATSNLYCAQAGDPLQELSPQYHGASGTSFAAPAAGSIALLRYYYQTNYGLVPSPALYKAMLIGGARSITGGIDRLESTVRGTTYTVERWPNTQQGWGLINLADLLASTPMKDWVNQQVVMTQGQTYDRQVYVTDPTKPVRVVLAWTDKEGAPFAAVAQVNDLNLRGFWPDGMSVTGNSIDTSGWSYVTGGCGRPTCPVNSDNRNNVEVLNINASRFAGGANRTFTVRVIANTLNGVAVTGQSGGANNQDFALFVMNGAFQ